ncbi:rRNA maturation RNase YbeY [soil metagenome]
MAVAVRVQPGAALSRRSAVPDRPGVRRILTSAVRATLRREDVGEAEISITLLDDDEISAMNRDFLRHDGPTDVISFALFEDDETPVGDVYIGYHQAERQAAAAGIPLPEELARLSVHGVLHVLGYDHPPGAERTASPMWQTQEDIVRSVLDG